MTEDERKASEAIDAIEAESDIWAVEVGLMVSIKQIAHVSRLAPKVPHATREKMIARQEALMDALMRQAFIEGAVRAIEIRNKK